MKKYKVVVAKIKAKGLQQIPYNVVVFAMDEEDAKQKAKMEIATSPLEKFMDRFGSVTERFNNLDVLSIAIEE